MLKPQRKTIGVVLDWLVFGDNALYYQSTILKGADQFCRAKDYNMCAFTVGRFDSSNMRESRNNFLFNMVTPEIVDGVVVFPSIGFFTGKDKLESLIRSLHPLPTVVLSNRYDGIPSVIIDNYYYMKLIIEHLIVVHNAKRVAFIRGIDGNHDAELRFQAYRDVLSEHNIVYNENLVLRGDYVVQSGMDAVEKLFENKTAFDAIAAANDQMAIGAIRALEARGLYGFPVTGFDNLDGARKWSLTTIDQQLFEEGYECARLAAEMIEGRPVEPVTVVPCRFVQRSSCGCPHESVSETAGPVNVNVKSADDHYKKIAGAFLGKIQRPVQKKAFSSIIAQIEQQLRKNSIESVLMLWERVLKLSQLEKIDPAQQLALFEALQKKILLVSETSEAMTSVAAMGYLTGIYSDDFTAFYNSASDSVTQSLDSLGEDLFDTLDIRDQSDLLFNKLRFFDIDSCLIARYADPSNPLDLSQAILAYTPEGRLDVDELYATKSLFPVKFSQDLRNQRYSILVQPFSAGDSAIGYIAVSISDLSDKSMLLTRNRINIALKESLYVEALEKQIRERTQQLTITNEKLTQTIESNKLLMRELEHRVKNNLGVVAGLLSLEAFSAESEAIRDVLIESRTRIESMAAIYERLYKQPNHDNRIDAGPYIEDLVKSLMKTYSLGTTTVRLKLYFEECFLDLKRVISIGLFINELVSNSLKYAWPDRSSGTLEITLVQAEDKYLLELIDDGVGLSEAAIDGKVKSLGLVLVKSFAAELGAELKITGDHGTRVSLLFSK